MASEKETKSADELAKSTGADSAVIAKEYEAAAEVAGADDESIE